MKQGDKSRRHPRVLTSDGKTKIRNNASGALEISQ